MSLALPSTASTGSSASPSIGCTSYTSDAFTTQSLQGFRTVPLAGLDPGTHLGILASGLLDKRRDGAVRGGWAKRLFILSTRSLHYYRKTEETELFGKERGHVHLSDIALAKVVMPEDAPAGALEPGISSYFVAVLSKRKTLLIFLRAESFEYASSWVSIVNNAVHTAKNVNFAPRWSVETMEAFISAASGAIHCEESKLERTKSPTEVTTTSPIATPPTPSVLVVSMVSGPLGASSTTERLVRRHIELNTEFLLGAFEQKDTCIIVLSDGEELYIPRRKLGSDNLLVSSKQLELTTPTRGQSLLRPHIVSMSRVFVSFRCIRASPVPATRRDSCPQSVMPSLPLTFTVAFPGTLGGLFLISCLVSFYCAAPFVGLMKITIVLGLLLSISQITQFIICISNAQSRKRFNPAVTPTGGSKKAVAVTAVAGGELVYLFTVQKIEVIEADQDVKLALSDTMSPAASADVSIETEAQAISGGPIAFSPRFISGEKGDVEKGRARYLSTLEWRKENRVDDILVTPHPNFAIIKKHYPQFFHGRTRDGLPVYYERPGKINLSALKREGLLMDDLLRHYMYMTEYLWRVVEPSDEARSITVLDVAGIGMYDLGGEVLDFIKRASALSGAHYPERSAHIFIVNIPGWFNMIWRMVKPLIDPVTRQKVHMLKSNGILRELEKLIDRDNIPSDFGGNGVALGDSNEERALAVHVKKYLSMSCSMN